MHTPYQPLSSSHCFLTCREHCNSENCSSSLWSILSPREPCVSFSLFPHLFSKNHLYQGDFTKSSLILDFTKSSLILCMQIFVTMPHFSPKDLLPSNIIIHLIFYWIFMCPVLQVCHLLEGRGSFCLLDILGPSWVFSRYLLSE